MMPNEVELFHMTKRVLMDLCAGAEKKGASADAIATALGACLHRIADTHLDCADTCHASCVRRSMHAVVDGICDQMDAQHAGAIQ